MNGGLFVLVIGRTYGVLLVFLLLNACVPPPTPLQEELSSKAMTTVKSFYSFDSIELRMLQNVSAEIME